MSNLSLKSDGTEITLPSNCPLEISKGSLQLSLSFNDQGGFTLTHNGMSVAAARATPTQQEMKPGTVMPDGTVYAGISPDTGRAFYAAAQDEPKLLTWQDALDRTAFKGAHGHKDWRVPTRRELNILFNNHAAIGGFDVSGSFPAGWYWSSSEITGSGARGQRFSDGMHLSPTKTNGLSLRCVR